MDEVIWVRRFMKNWPDGIPRELSDTPFHRVARTVDPDSLLPDPEVVAVVVPQGDEDRTLLMLWPAWEEFVAGDRRQGSRQLKSISKQLFHRPEPFVLLACAALLEDNRALAIRALRRAVKARKDYRAALWLLEQFGSRKQPVLSFLPRTNPINVWLGKVRHRLNQ